MTLTRDTLRGGRLNISPAVLPDVTETSPRSSYDPESALSNTLAPPSKIQTLAISRTDVQTGLYDGSSGLLDLIFIGPAPGYTWKVQRASIGSVADEWDSCQVHAGTINDANPFETLVDNSDVPNTDIADEDSPIFVQGGQALTFRFIASGASAAGDDATARIQYVEQGQGAVGGG